MAVALVAGIFGCHAIEMTSRPVSPAALAEIANDIVVHVASSVKLVDERGAMDCLCAGRF